MGNRPGTSSRSSPGWGAWGLSIANGVIGDHLHAQQNGLAMDMALYHQGRPLRLSSEGLLAAHPHLTGQLCILVHGFACNEGIWTFRDSAQPELETSYGTLLRNDLGYTPFYLRYNTGLALAENGQRLAALMDELSASYPVPIQEIVLIGHSMGGLVLRSACHYGTLRQSTWVRQVRKLFYLATPHDGVALVQLGFLTTNILYAIPNPITHLIGDIIHLWSQGVKDLRYGTPLVAVEKESLTGGRLHPEQTAIPWIATAEHYLIAGTVTADAHHPAARILGDGLVGIARPRTPSTAGDARPSMPRHTMKLFPGKAHLQLTRDLQVYRQIHEWCTNRAKE